MRVVPDCFSSGALNFSRPFLSPGIIKNISPNGNILYTAYIKPEWGGHLCKTLKINKVWIMHLFIYPSLSVFQSAPEVGPVLSCQSGWTPEEDKQQQKQPHLQSRLKSTSPHLRRLFLYLNKKDEVFEWCVEVGLLLQLHHRVEVLMIDVSIDSEQALQDGLCHWHKVSLEGNTL